MSEQERLRLLCWGGYEEPAFLAGFARRSGVEVAAETFLCDHDALARVRQEGDWDLVNINNPFLRDALYPEGLVVPLASPRLAQDLGGWPADVQRFFACARSRDGGLPLGVLQRFGPFNFVINANRVSQAMAEDEGFALFLDGGKGPRYGILDYPDFNAMHIAIAVGLNPFQRLSATELARFERAARVVFAGARLISGDHHRLNRALLDGEIDLYLSGGAYTASPVRRQGYRNIRGVTPTRGPIEGRGGIAFVEVTGIGAAACARPGGRVAAEAFLAYMLEPEQTLALAFAEDSSNAVVQLANPRLRARCSANQLATIQWDDFEADMARCAPYESIPNFEGLRAVLRGIGTAA